MRNLLLVLLSLFTLSISAQIYNPVKWSYEVEPVSGNEYKLLFKANIEKDWHLYAAHLSSDEGPIATSFYFKKGDHYSTKGAIKDGNVITKFDKVFEMDLSYYEKSAVFTQIVKWEGKAPITGELEFMVCTDERCLPPEIIDFSFAKPSAGGAESKKMDAAVDENTKSEEAGEETGTTIFDPVDWSYEIKQIDEFTFDINFTASIDEGWYVYSQYLSSEDGPIATVFSFEDAEGMQLQGKTKEPKAEEKYDPNFLMDLAFFTEEVTFTQRVKTDGSLNKVKGYFEFMVCNAERCLPPEMVDFEFDLTPGPATNLASLETASTDNAVAEVVPTLPKVDLENPLGTCGERQEISNVWMVFLFGFLGGLLALLTPCVFPMIPLTVSFFTKGEGGSKGVGKAVLYGFFIFFIYAVLSVPFHFNTDPEVLNEIATSVWLNLIFFGVFVFFAISFFGFFEITLPSSLANKTDSASQVGGVLGIFFMALTLALVSFSCTGPILGTVLGNALKNGPWPITAAMSGFGVALGLPFAIFATFPSMMAKLPKSGGWLNSVKVVLGFIELALALKFISNADLVEQWGLVKRETFFLIWSVIGIGLAAYLFGWLKFPHDSKLKKLSTGRLAFAVSVLLFTVYISTGVLKNSPWNHNLLSGFPPPTFYSWYEKEGFHAEYDDFAEAMEAAKAENKPILIDFTGWACVNCRKMEESVWTVDEVKERLEKDFVLVSLYVDDKVKLPEEQQGVIEFEANGEIIKKKIRTIGNKWATFQTQVFNNNSQPYYVMLSPEGELLGNPVGYTPNVEDYLQFLDCGINTFKSKEVAGL
ncbi:protein-disulfide reductase DsbD family protein [Luteibaculum oceani]|uniref:DUF255 domain-containing protein n=1 Tax=Luteibaculum oceani TaxID=1294296 RepID=A0A5C6V9B9_9FLAO|nr:thioredoxin family protein [Luteibaculum oceani]TXC81769.1 DUF255 domain-containing protein [Luteibaculum oceani]